MGEALPGLFSRPFSKEDPTGELRPVDRCLKGIKGGDVSTGTGAKGRVTVPCKRPMNELVDASEV